VSCCKVLVKFVKMHVCLLKLNLSCVVTFVLLWTIVDGLIFIFLTIENCLIGLSIAKTICTIAQSAAKK